MPKRELSFYDDDLFNFNKEETGSNNQFLDDPQRSTEALREDYNVAFITVDSLSFKVYKKARDLGYTDGLDSFGKVFPAIAPASFTLPSHSALFGGHLPQVLGDNTSLGLSRKNRLFNSATSNAEQRNIIAGFLLEGKDIFDGFRQRNFQIKAFCGAIFFEKVGDKIGPLTHYFEGDELTYFRDSVSMKRTKEDVPIGNVKTIVDSIESVGETPWFLFINETSTHAPYVFNDQALESEINAKIKQRFVRHKALFQGKVDPNITYENTGKVFEQAQIAALNFFDSQLQKLIEKLKQTTRRNVLLIICGDHGECFGDATFMGEKKSGYFGHCWNGAEENIVVPLLINIIKPESNQED